MRKCDIQGLTASACVCIKEMISCLKNKIETLISMNNAVNDVILNLCILMMMI